MTFRIGILGAGDMGNVHANILRADPRVQVVAVADPDTERARLLAAPSRAKILGSLEELLSEGINILFICSPNFTHAQAAIAALKENVHVFSEKPMAVNEADAGRIAEAAAKSSGIYQLGFNRRFSPAYVAIREKISAGFIPYLLDIKMNEGEISNRPWAMDTKKTGGHLHENVLHFFDLIQWLQGPIREIFAFGRKNVYEDMTDFTISFVTQNERLASISTSGHATWFHPWERVEVIGNHEAMITNEVEDFTYSPGNRREIQTKHFYQFSREVKWGYEGEIRAFLDSIEKGTPSLYTAEMGLEIFRLVECAYESARTGKKVTIPPKTSGAPQLIER